MGAEGIQQCSEFDQAGIVALTSRQIFFLCLTYYFKGTACIVSILVFSDFPGMLQKTSAQ